MGELRTSLRGSALMVEVGRQWGEQSEVEKQKYHERWEKVLDYIRLYAWWTCPSLSVGQVLFQFLWCLVCVFIFILF